MTIGSFTADTLPASFNAPAEAEISYKIYGTEAGVGTATGEGEPAGYKISLSVNDTPTPIYIGESKLGSDEYVDYQDRKIYKLKEVHEDTVTIDGVVWDILGYDHDEVYDGEGNLAQHSVTIQTHDCIAELQFDAREALFAFPNGASAGTYHFTVSQQQWYSGDVGKTMQFTLLNDIPANGVIVLGNGYNATMIGSTISIYASPSATTANETATISEGSGGTDLGSVGNAISGDTNSIQRALLGNNTYHQSAIRQYLNSDGTAGTYWMPQNKWDRPPSWRANQAGFLNAYSANFKSAIGTTKKVTALNTVTDGGGTETTNEKVFLLSETEAYCGGSEGTAYSYYANYSDLSEAGIGEDSNRIKTYNGAATYWWFRCPNISNPINIYIIDSLGKRLNSSTDGDHGISPAVCIPLDNINNDSYLQSLFLKPVDPPAPLPAITASGENTITSTETLGDVELTGEWTAIMGSTEAESIDIDFTVDADSYIAFVTVDDDPSIQVFDTITMPASASSFTLQVVSWGREQYTDTVYNALS
ncbi:MAG: hypothetical protein IIZ78_00440 [Clostridiales bacterium]|nr:hypothetical protein [Clostridiales bacterium]